MTEGLRVCRVELPVRYAFAFEHMWSSGQKAAFAHQFEARTRQTWSRRFTAQSSSLEQIEFDVTVRPGVSKGNDFDWIVHVYPDIYTDVTVRVNYNHRGVLEGVDESYYGVGVVHLKETSVSYAAVGRHSQRGSDHEVGHMLGVQHPNGSANDSTCYGTTEAELTRVMGEGRTMTHDDYYWALAIVRRALPHRSWALR